MWRDCCATWDDLITMFLLVVMLRCPVTQLFSYLSTTAMTVGVRDLSVLFIDMFNVCLSDGQRRLSQNAFHSLTALTFMSRMTATFHGQYGRNMSFQAKGLIFSHIVT